MTVSEIAASVGVHPSTIRRWKKSDEGTPGDWEEKREARGDHDPLETIRLLEKRLDDIASNAEMDPQKAADSILKIERCIGMLRERYVDIDRSIKVFKQFAEYLYENYESDSTFRAKVSEAVKGFLGEQNERLHTGDPSSG